MAKKTSTPIDTSIPAIEQYALAKQQLTGLKQQYWVLEKQYAYHSIPGFEDLDARKVVQENLNKVGRQIEFWTETLLDLEADSKELGKETV